MLEWARDKQVTNFDALLGAGTLITLVLGAAVIFFYLGVRTTCINTTDTFDKEAECVLGTIEKVLEK